MNCSGCGQILRWEDGAYCQSCMEKEMAEPNANVHDLVRRYLEGSGFDGLFNEAGQCACDTEDLAPCGEMSGDCELGYKATPEQADALGACTDDDADWYIVRTKPRDKA